MSNMLRKDTTPNKSSPDDSSLSDPPSSDSGDDVLEDLSAESGLPSTTTKAPAKTTKKGRSASKAPKSDETTKKTAPAFAEMKITAPTEHRATRASTAEGKRKMSRQVERDPRNDGFGGGGPIEQRVSKKVVDKVVPNKEKKRDLSAQHEKGATAGRKMAEKQRPSKPQPDEQSTGEEVLELEEANKGKKGKKRQLTDREPEEQFRASQLTKPPPVQLQNLRITRSKSVATSGKQDRDPIVPIPSVEDSQVEHRLQISKASGRNRTKAPPVSKDVNKEQATNANIGHKDRPIVRPQRAFPSVPSQLVNTLAISDYAYDTEGEERLFNIGIEKTSGRTNHLDTEAEQMFIHILKLASNPREWLDFLGKDDYTIATGEVLVTEFGHTSAYDTLVYLFGKMNDNATKKYEQTCFDYKDIKLQIGEEADRHRPNEIWKAYTDLVNGTSELGKMTGEERAMWYNNIWKKIVSRNPYLLRAADTEPHQSHNLSYVLLLVLTLASRQALGDYIQRNDALLAKHNLWYEDSVSDLLKHLRQDKYADFPTWKVTQIFHHLTAKLQEEQEKLDITTESDSNSELEEAAPNMAPASNVVGKHGTE